MAKLLEMPDFKPSDLLTTGLEMLNDMLAAIRALVKVDDVIATFSPTNPAEYIGGTWQNLGARFLYGVENDGQVGETGGATSHYHRENTGWDPTNGIFAYSNGGMPYFGSEKIDVANSLIFRVDSEGRNAAARIGHTDTAGTLPPYVRCYLWRRMS